MCAVTGIRNLVRAVHTVANFTDEADRGHANGIALAPHIRELFDHGLIAFDGKGHMLVSERLSPGERHQLRLPADLSRIPTRREKELFRDHRKSVFLGASS
jgi:hypothetical protein